MDAICVRGFGNLMLQAVTYRYLSLALLVDAAVFDRTLRVCTRA